VLAPHRSRMRTRVRTSTPLMHACRPWHPRPSPRAQHLIPGVELLLGRLLPILALLLGCKKLNKKYIRIKIKICLRGSSPSLLASPCENALHDHVWSRNSAPVAHVVLHHGSITYIIYIIYIIHKIQIFIIYKYYIYNIYLYIVSINIIHVYIYIYI
jgi:hypothetical protein